MLLLVRGRGSADKAIGFEPVPPGWFGVLLVSRPRRCTNWGVRSGVRRGPLDPLLKGLLHCRSVALYTGLPLGRRRFCARRVIGAFWQGDTATADSLRASPEWMKYVEADPADSLEQVGEELNLSEIEEAYNHMSTGKATQNDAVSKELMDLVPPEYKRMFTTYIQHTFNTGQTDIEEYEESRPKPPGNHK